MKIFNRDKAPKAPRKSFDENGLRYDINYLNKMFPRILFLPIEQQALFVDAVTFYNCKFDWDPGEEDFLNPDTSLENINCTSIGNMAYIALNHLRPEVREHHKQQLEGLKKRFSQTE